MTTMARPLFLFDGDCGVCQNGTDTMRRRFDPPVDLSAYQLVDLATFGITDDEVSEGPVLVRVDSSHVVGPLAIAEVLSASRPPYRLIGRAMLLPMVRSVLRSLGPWAYRQRYRVPGASATCRMPVA